MNTQTMTSPVLILPGLGGSSQSHWQSHWCSKRSQCRLVEQDNWNIPEPSSWINALQSAVVSCAAPPLLVAHSLSCALVAHWAQRHHDTPIRGALLVAPSDVESEDHTPMEVRCFAPIPMAQLPFPSTVIASSNDPYVDIIRAQLFATAWGSSFVNIGECGHINADSHLGEWHEGWGLLQDLEEAQGLSCRA
ncbi:alpha/beta hydrolase [Magnetovibrio sp. PR-2]|uniref:RBBP9/YdeN family alpha/beta hydrolase n=1 Tax=Magnetovibrio sp. PR-2 TaxID=3120356 RepID=UPI002FCE2865